MRGERSIQPTANIISVVEDGETESPKEAFGVVVVEPSFLRRLRLARERLAAERRE
jgi:hypothetical protein